MTRRIFDLRNDSDRADFERLHADRLRGNEKSTMLLDKHLCPGCVYVKGINVYAAADVIAAMYAEQHENSEHYSSEPTPTGSVTIIATINYNDGSKVPVKLTRVKDEVAISLLSVFDQAETTTLPADCDGYHKEGDDELFITVSEACRVFPAHSTVWRAFEDLYRETLAERAASN